MMGLRELIGKRLVFFDGGMGTLLQAAGLPVGTAPDLWNVERPEVIQKVHADYFAAGCDIVKTNTFGANSYKLKGAPYSVDEVVKCAVKNAREAAGNDKERFVALDIGPTGKLLRPVGDLGFEDAYELFKETVIAGADGADAVLIETQNDLYELKAAVLAAKENCSLPVFATVTLDEKGRLLTGADVETVAALLEGLRVDAIGINCGYGPAQMLPFFKRLREVSSLPLIINPNAGIPRSKGGKTSFDVGPDEFAETMEQAAGAGAWLLGGCCGTTPEYIEKLTARLKGFAPVPFERKNRTVVSSCSRAVVIGEKPLLIGERINPTGKRRMKEALAAGNMDYLLSEAIKQEERGAQLLDVNTGLPEIDESEALCEAVTAIQGVSELPLQIDTADPDALERALRLYNGKPLINSVNGKEESLKCVLPLAAKYGGVLVALTLDDDGIPATARGRVEVARKIIERAAQYGIDKKDIVADPLTLAVSAEPDSAGVTLEALRLIKSELGVSTLLGVSNISFGLPCRETLNAAFFTLALEAGLSLAIMNPYSDMMTGAYDAFCALSGFDRNFEDYIKNHAEIKQEASAASAAASLFDSIKKGLKGGAAAAAGELIKTQKPLEIIERELIPALNEVGRDFETGSVFLPQLLMSAEAAKSAFEVIRGALSSNERGGRGKIVLATVQGDIHDIGKNIVKSLLENFRFDVVDLGRDVPPERVVEAAIKENAGAVGLSALMTTTLPAMQQTIALLKERSPECKTLVGGAVLTKDYAKTMGADYYAKDAMEAVRCAEEIFR